MELSKRLYAVAGLVTEGASVADIGTDHGYVPIYLVESGIASHLSCGEWYRRKSDRFGCKPGAP